MTINELKEEFADPKFYFCKAYDLACEAHKNDKRWGGEPYMTHIDEVILISYESCKGYINKTFLDYIITIAALHDTYEDHREEYPLGFVAERLEFLDNDAAGSIMLGIDLISKKPKGEQKYTDYILGVKNHKWARIVKIADLSHNIKDLKYGNMRDKYDLSLYILSSYSDFR